MKTYLPKLKDFDSAFAVYMAAICLLISALSISWAALKILVS